MQNPDADGLDAHAALWTTELDQYVLVPVRWPDGRTFYDLYHRDGTYSTLADEELNRAAAERMLAAGAQVMDPDAWVLAQKTREFERFWTSGPETYLVVRYVLAGEPATDVIHDESGTAYPIYEEGVSAAVVARMVAAGAELIEVAGDLRDEGDGARQEGNDQVEREHDTYDPGGEHLFRLLVQPAFAPWLSWHFHRRHHDGGPPTYSARFVTWKYESPLAFRQRIRLPYAEQGWQLSLVREDVQVDTGEAERMLRTLLQVRVPVFVDDLSGGRDGVTYRLTVGEWPHSSEWVWWGQGPAEWEALVHFAGGALESFDRLRPSSGNHAFDF